jgi:hypothetical protein
VQLHAASGRTIGLGQHQGDVYTSIVQRRQCNCGEFWRASKNDTHD